MILPTPCPSAHQCRMRTSNPIERLNQELKRRTRVPPSLQTKSLFSDSSPPSSAKSAKKISKEWLSGKIYLNMKPADLPPK